jgi:hypothetical protein
MRPLASIATIAVLGALACIGCSSVDGATDETGSQTPAAASEQTGPQKLQSLDESCDGRFSGRGLLDIAGTERKATLEPAAGGGTSTELTFRVRYAGGAIVCEPQASFMVRGTQYTNPTKLTVDVELSIETADGSFREMRTVTLSQSSSPIVRSDGTLATEAPGEGVVLYASIPTASIEGSFRSANASDHDVVFWGTLGRTATDGTVDEQGIANGFEARWH